MKATWWLVILLAGAVVLSSVAGSFGRSKKSSAKSPTPPAVERKEANDIVVDGYGETEQAARANALRKAVEVVEVQLGEKFETKRGIPARLVSPSFLESRKVLTDDGKPEKDPDAENAIRARYKITLTNAYLDEVAREARKEWLAEEKEQRQERVVGRHLFLLRILGGILAVLLVVAGYFRMEEATRGYYTTLLRVGAIGVLAAAAVGLLLTL